MKSTGLLTGIGVLILLAGSLAAQEKNAGKGIDGATVTAFWKAGWEYGGWTKNPRDGGYVFRVGDSYAKKGYAGAL
jgi:hypothetical protein